LFSMGYDGGIFKIVITKELGLFLGVF